MAPADELVTRALARLGDLQHRRVFYERLENPLWIEPLDARGALAPEPGAYTGRGFVQPWPQGDYLQRMAPLAPVPVAAVLTRFLDSESPVVRSVILKAAAQMDGTSAAALVKGIVSFIRDFNYFDHEELLRLVANLVTAGELKSARSLVNAVYEPRADEADAADPAKRRRGENLVGLDDYWYAHTLPRVAQLLAGADADFLKGLSHWVKTVQTIREYSTDDEYYDGSDSDRPSIRPHEQNWGHDEVAETLVDVLRDLAREQLASGTDVSIVAARVLAGDRPIHRRVLQDAIAWRVETDPSSWDQLGEAAEALLSKREDFEGSCRHEMILLAQASLPRMSPAALAQLTETVMNGPARSDEELAEMLARWHGGSPDSLGADAAEATTDEAAADEVTRYRERWRYRLLAAIGEPRLSGELGVELQRLASELGPIEHPDFDSWHGSGWVGPTSPATSEELAAMQDDDLLHLLETWRAEPGQHWVPTVDGLARSLEDTVAADPKRFGPLLPRFGALPISYTRSTLRGLERGLEAGEAFDWLPVLMTCREVVSRQDIGDHVPDIEDDDRTWAWTKRQVGSLLGGAVQEATWTSEERTIVIETLALLGTHPDPARDGEDSGSGMDSLTLSLNTVRPTAVRALLRLTLGDLTHDERSRIETLLDQHAGPEADPALAVAATFGEALGALVSNEATAAWTASRLDRLLGPLDLDASSAHELAYWDTVWSIFLTRYIPHPALLEPLRAYFCRAIATVESGREPTEGWRQQRNQAAAVGDFLVSLVARGSLALDDPLIDAFFAAASPALRGKVLGHWGWQLFRAEDLSSDVLERSQALLEVRAAVSTDEESELDDFTWWARIRQADPGWWLPLLVQASRSTTFDSRGLLGEVLAQTASAHPQLTLLALTQLLALRGEDSWKAYDLLEHAPRILAAVLDSGFDEVQRDAQDLIDRLGREGYLDLADRVAEHRTATAG